MQEDNITYTVDLSRAQADLFSELKPVTVQYPAMSVDEARRLSEMYLGGDKLIEHYIVMPSGYSSRTCWFNVQFCSTEIKDKCSFVCGLYHHFPITELEVNIKQLSTGMLYKYKIRDLVWEDGWVTFKQPIYLSHRYSTKFKIQRRHTPISELEHRHVKFTFRMKTPCIGILTDKYDDLVNRGINWGKYLSQDFVTDSENSAKLEDPEKMVYDFFRKNLPQNTQILYKGDLPFQDVTIIIPKYKTVFDIYDDRINFLPGTPDDKKVIRSDDEEYQKKAQKYVDAGYAFGSILYDDTRCWGLPDNKRGLGIMEAWISLATRGTLGAGQRFY